MKNNKILYVVMLAMGFAISSCGDDDESCEKDELCEVEYSVCCSSDNDDDCTYVVDGTEYDSFEEASDNFECSASVIPNEDKSRIREALKALTASAKANL